MDDLQLHVSSADPAFEPSCTLMWREYSPQKTQQDMLDTAMGEADKKISALENNKTEACWQADILKLAKDASMCAKLLQAAQQGEKTLRLAKITHIKEQNQIGAQIIADFSQKTCLHVTQAAPEAEQHLSQARVAGFVLAFVQQ